MTRERLLDILLTDAGRLPKDAEEEWMDDAGRYFATETLVVGADFRPYE